MRLRTSTGSLATSCPSTFTLPEVGRSRVVIILMVVVLPAPFGPSMPNSSPLFTSKEMWSTANVSFFFLRNRSDER